MPGRTLLGVTWVGLGAAARGGEPRHLDLQALVLDCVSWVLLAGGRLPGVRALDG